MKIYEIMKGIAEELEQARLGVLEAEQGILKDENLSAKRKVELVQELKAKYWEKVANTNEVKDKAIERFQEEKSLKGISASPEKLNGVLGIIKNVSNPLTDDELFNMTKDIQQDYMSMQILKKQIENAHNYPKTFGELAKKEMIDKELESLNRLKGLYFSDDLRYTHIKYSLNALEDFDNNLRHILKYGEEQKKRTYS